MFSKLVIRNFPGKLECTLLQVILDKWDLLLLLISFLFPVGKRLEMESNDAVVVIQTLAMLQTELVFWKNYERHKHVVELYSLTSQSFGIIKKFDSEISFKSPPRPPQPSRSPCEDETLQRELPVWLHYTHYMLESLQSADRVPSSFTDYLKQQQVSCITPPLLHGGKENTGYRRNWDRYSHETQVHFSLGTNGGYELFLPFKSLPASALETAGLLPPI